MGKAGEKDTTLYFGHANLKSKVTAISLECKGQKLDCRGSKMELEETTLDSTFHELWDKGQKGQ